MEAFLPESVKTALLGLIATVIVLAWLARTFPDAGWLRLFRFSQFQLSEEQKARHRRAGNRQAAFEIILAGLILPLLYVASTVMMFNDFKTIPTILVAAGSLLCLAAGIWMLVRKDR